MSPGALAGAVVLALALVLLRRRLEPALLAGGALVAAALLVLGLGVVQLPDPEQALSDAGDALGAWMYAIVPVMAFLETGAFVGLVAPGETFMVFGGVVAGQGQVDLAVLIALTWAAAVAGDVTSYGLGRRLGRDFLIRHGPKVQITEARLHKVEAFFARHGGKTILIGRFIGLVRAVAPFLAGSSGMPLRRFLPYDVLGAGAWATLFVVLGYVFWQSFGTVLEWAHRGVTTFGVLVVVVLAVALVVRTLRDPERRELARRRVDGVLDRPAARPVADGVLRPLWRRSASPRAFALRRLTPGGIGLGFTTLAAVAVAGAALFATLWIVLDGEPTTASDRRALRIAADLHADWLVRVAKVLTRLGSLPVAGGVLVVAALALAVHWRRVTEAVTLVAGMALTYGGVHLAKDATDRPRPPRPLQEPDLSSFPSGHSAYAVAWVAVALVLARVAPGVGRAVAVVLGAVLVAVLVGLTRMYLRVHYLSDVLGGIGMASAIFALCGMTAMVVVRLRHNPRGP